MAESAPRQAAGRDRRKSRGEGPGPLVARVPPGPAVAITHTGAFLCFGTASDPQNLPQRLHSGNTAC